MFYTKLVIQNSDPVVMTESYTATVEKRWDFVAVNTTGGTTARRLAADSNWTLSAKDIDWYNSTEAKARYDQRPPMTFQPGVNYYEAIRFWDSATVAQDFVTAVQALNLAGVTISYEGDTDPATV